MKLKAMDQGKVTIRTTIKLMNLITIWQVAQGLHENGGVVQ